MSLDRDVVVDRERNIKLQVRVEFQNIFNRLFLASPIPSSGGNVQCAAHRDESGCA